jgi:transposase
VDIQLIFEGGIEEFIATNHLKKKIVVNKENVMGIDLNRRGKYVVVSNLDVEMPDEILEQSRRWDVVLDKIKHLQYLQSKTGNTWRKRIYQFQIEDLYRRKLNLRKDYHLRLANWVGIQLVACEAEALVIEDLNVSTYGTRGALAKAIESMADDTSLYAREVLAVRKFTNRDLELRQVSAYNSSRIHVECGGTLRRDFSKKHYDIAPCSGCKEMVNTHKNAAIHLVRSTKP